VTLIATYGITQSGLFEGSALQLWND